MKAAPKLPKFKKGDKVMITSENYDIKWDRIKDIHVVKGYEYHGDAVLVMIEDFISGITEENLRLCTPLDEELR